MEPYGFTPRGFQALTVGTAAGTLTIPASGADFAMIHVGGAINWRDDGTDPAVGTSGTVGYPVAAGGDLWYDGFLDKFKAVAQSGTAVLSINYYG